MGGFSCVGVFRRYRLVCMWDCGFSSSGLASLVGWGRAVLRFDVFRAFVWGWYNIHY